ncbi:uncharacterized protein ColSpa_00131 [Colletotrichum spaethianum]|uniref:Uncharacterized protein n=1 Tax=Colletotrichum spaethianum TaxID=700344 RepID=A0AA37NV61_9PEZI|nr:uncharacterized protein ColSpa_00131 [Colletotrichum spaethianum]GKT39950.1 hypothetical protein ColSpa_00131 [Colletotrichum spaethianum]
MATGVASMIYTTRDWNVNACYLSKDYNIVPFSQFKHGVSEPQYGDRKLAQGPPHATLDRRTAAGGFYALFQLSQSFFYVLDLLQGLRNVLKGYLVTGLQEY